jgi:hypothetical protein
MMTLEEHLQIVYPEGAPSDVIIFLGGTAPDENIRSASYSKVVSTAKHYGEQHRKIVERAGHVGSHIDMRRRDIAAINTILNHGDYLNWELDWLIPQLQRKQAFETILGRAEQELAELKSSPFCDRDRAQSWARLTELAQVRLEDGIPSARIAAAFDSTPEQMTTPERWTAHLAEIEAARLADEKEKERIRAEQLAAVAQREAEAAAEAERLRIEEQRRIEALQQYPEYHRVEAMSLERLLDLVFPGDDVPGYDPRKSPFTASARANRGMKIGQLVSSFERGEIGGELRQKISDTRSICGEADRARKFACTKLLQIAEAKQPTPVGAPQYL